MTFVLRPHQSCANSPYTVEGEVQIRDRIVEWTMIALAQKQNEWVTHPRFGPDPRKNWELWNFDVVENFLQPRNNAQNLLAPYLELQVSPLNQAFALMILKPRVSFYTPLQVPLESRVELTHERWLTQVTIKLPSGLEQGDVYGGFFACLGANDRGFFSLQPNLEERPDFHRPELFKKL